MMPLACELKGREEIWKDMVVAEYKVLFAQVIGMTKEIRETCQDIRHPAGFRVEYLHNTNQVRFVLFCLILGLFKYSFHCIGCILCSFKLEDD